MARAVASASASGLDRPRSTGWARFAGDLGLVAAILWFLLAGACLADALPAEAPATVTLEQFSPLSATVLDWGTMVPMSARIVATPSLSEPVTYRALLAVNGHAYHAYVLQLLPGDAVVRTTITWFVDIHRFVNRVDFRIQQQFPDRNVTRSAGALRLLYWGRPKLGLIAAPAPVHTSMAAPRSR